MLCPEWENTEEGGGGDEAGSSQSNKVHLLIVRPFSDSVFFPFPQFLPYSVEKERNTSQNLFQFYFYLWEISITVEEKSMSVAFSLMRQNDLSSE